MPTHGEKQLLVSLHSKGLDFDDAKKALNKVLDEETEFSMLERFVKKISRKKNSQTENARLLKITLKNEGFSIGVIRRFLNDE